MAMKLIKLDNGLMMEVEVSHNEIEEISGGRGGDEIIYPSKPKKTSINTGYTTMTDK